MKKILVILSGFYLGACSTMEFVNGPKMEETIVREKWHHLGLGGLIEFSKPMDLTYHCGKEQWDSIVVEQNVFNALSSATTSFVPPFILGIYSPWTIVYECRDPID